MKAFYAIALAALAASAAAVTIKEIDLHQGEKHIEWLETNKDAGNDQMLRIMYVLETEADPDDAATDVTVELDGVVQYTLADGFAEAGEGVVLTKDNAKWETEVKSLPGGVKIAALTFLAPELAMEGPYKVTIKKAADAGGEARNDAVYDVKAQKSCEDPIEFNVEEDTDKCLAKKFAGGCSSGIYPLDTDKSNAGIWSDELEDWVKEFPMVEGKPDEDDGTVPYYIDVDAEANTYTVGPDTPMDAVFRYALYSGGYIDSHENDIFGKRYALTGCPDWREFCESNGDSELAPAAENVPANIRERFLTCEFTKSEGVKLVEAESCRGKTVTPENPLTGEQSISVKFQCQSGRNRDEGTEEFTTLNCVKDGSRYLWKLADGEDMDKFTRCGASAISASMGLFVAAMVAVKSLF